MIWLIPAFISAITQSTADLLSKKGLQTRDEYAVAFYFYALSLPILIAILIVIGIPIIGQKFFEALFIGGSLNTIATILYMRAIKLSPLSMTIPMLAFTPVFMLFTSPLILNEHTSTMGVYGIIFITMGAYLLNFDKFGRNLLHPFKMITKEMGVLLMLFVALIFSVTANFDKVGMINSSSVFWTFSINLFLSISLGVIMIVKVRGNLKRMPQDIKTFLPMGALAAVSQIATVITMTLTLASYAIAIKRTSILFSSVYGFAVLKEKNVIQRMISISIMMVGIFILIFVK